MDTGDIPYRVPFGVDRSRPPRYLLRNESDEELRGVSAIVLGSGALTPRGPAILKPGEALVVEVRGSDLAVDTVLVVRWFRPSGEEYLWRVSF
ncbi:hypothetical protein [Compostimonas suwonensis]|uniref:Uncharacterized protein n=1 Tax=Compostimonas suwonensis TaxID=1048394 RepID=A0A2M9BVB8_9MICO|nr:hypothetical protein [Compostimonas suwonensis]PJJ61899.1 hypothetical protein CLV54_1686 [Compostimonas suwonensis]